jgi:hypothetical protein
VWGKHEYHCIYKAICRKAFLLMNIELWQLCLIYQAGRFGLAFRMAVEFMEGELARK